LAIPKFVEKRDINELNMSIANLPRAIAQSVRKVVKEEITNAKNDLAEFILWSR
jgi:hypothetical protein